MYKVIIEPKTNEIININTKKGKYIISNYIKFLYAGGRAPKSSNVISKKIFERIKDKEENRQRIKSKYREKKKKKEKEGKAIEIKSTPFIKTWDDWIEYAKYAHPDFFSEDYKFDYLLSSNGDYGVIFKTVKPPYILLKLVIVWTGTDELFNTNYKDISLTILSPLARSVIKIQEWNSEIDVLQKMSDNDIGPNLISHNLFKAIDINLGESRQREDGGELKIGVIKMDYLYNFVTLDKFIKKINLDDNKKLKSYICDEIINKLREMHKQKLCHGDLHTGNILINEDNFDIKFIDFGSSQNKELIGETVWEKESECGVSHTEIQSICLN